MCKKKTQFPKVIWMSILQYFAILGLYAQVGKALGRVCKMGFLVSVWPLLNRMTFKNYCLHLLLPKVRVSFQTAG